MKIMWVKLSPEEQQQRIEAIYCDQPRYFGVSCLMWPKASVASSGNTGEWITAKITCTYIITFYSVFCQMVLVYFASLESILWRKMQNSAYFEVYTHNPFDKQSE